MASVEACCSTQVVSRKRPHSPDTTNEICRKNCPNHFSFVLESESPVPTDEDSESVYSVQYAGTASAKDTSDTSWTSDSVTMDVEIEEYDVASAHSDEKFFTDCDSSGCDDLLATAAATASLLAEQASSVKAGRMPLEDDSSPWTPDLRASSSSDDSFDSEVPRDDYWECVRCKRKCTPLFRFCLKCFQLRKGYFGERPKRVHPRRRQRQRPRGDSRSVSRPGSRSPRSSPSPSSPRSLARADSGISGCAGDKEEEEEAAAKATKEAAEPVAGEEAEVKAGAGMEVEAVAEAGTGAEVVSGAGAGAGSRPTGPFASESERASELCFVCLERPRNGGFYHRSVIHVLTCYPCATKVWNTTRRCPMCNKPPVNIARLMFG